MIHSKILRIFKGVFKSEYSRFEAIVGLKITGISFLVTCGVYWFLSQILRMNYAFFTTHGFSEFRDVEYFFDLIFAKVLDNLSLLFIFHVGLFFLGAYVGRLMLRPFQNMGDYCEKVLEDVNYPYKVEQFSSYAIFTRFSEFFFEYLREIRKNRALYINSIPPQYLKIHQPILDLVFLLHFGLLLMIASMVSAIFIIVNTSMVYESMVELATKTLRDQKYVTKYFTEQIFIFDDIVILTIFLLMSLYFLLAVHLYSKISGASFAIFSTMRTFMKGNYSSRVHLLGYGYMREYTRKLNKYLDYMENNFSKDDSKK